MRVFCYRNLHYSGVVWSIKNTRSQLVVDHSTIVYLKDCDLVVQQGGRRRVLEEKRKNVHAGARGKRVSRGPANADWKKLHYNPYKFDSFVDAEGNKVKSAEYVKLCKNGCFGVGLKYD